MNCLSLVVCEDRCGRLPVANSLVAGSAVVVALFLLKYTGWRHTCRHEMGDVPPTVDYLKERKQTRAHTDTHKQT